MGYRVRNEHGELKFSSFDELQEAYRTHFVGPDDEVLEDGSTTWRKAGSLPKLVRPEPRRTGLDPTTRWYLLAGFVSMVGIALMYGLYRGVAGFAVVFGVALFGASLFMWSAFRKRR